MMTTKQKQQQQDGTTKNDDDKDETIETTDLYWKEDASGGHSLLGKKRRGRRRRRYLDDAIDGDDDSDIHASWIRPYWLGMDLFMILFSFWILDSLKDNVLAMLTNGNLERHQPPAKLFSVVATLVLVLALEYISDEQQKQHQRQRNAMRRTDEDVLSGGGSWDSMPTLVDSGNTGGNDSGGDDDNHHHHNQEDLDGVTSSIFAHIGVPYCIVFGIMAYVLQFNASVGTTQNKNSDNNNNELDYDSHSGKNRAWTMVGYAFYAAIESFGSIAVATFWSYANSTLNLEQAENYYGTIIAIAQLGAILGSTMVTTHVWSTITLIIVACLVILLHILMMQAYSARFPAISSGSSSTAKASSSSKYDHKKNTENTAKVSGIHLILKHNYVLLILGASCLYEISLTCLNYQMTLLGWNKYEGGAGAALTKLTFAQFMGHYGQMVNLSSLVLSSLLFPFLIHRVGLRWILRGFPTLLLLVNIMAFGILPGNLAVLFFSLAFLKAMTYSIHDPAKEILYLPTSRAIKFKAKFWIDVVGARIAKAVGSSINNLAGNVDRSIRIASTPSLLTACGLWIVCYKVGIMFEDLVATNTVVGGDDDDDINTNNNNNRQLLYETPSDDGYINDAGPNGTSDDDDYNEARHLVNDR